ncbi:hypothetical protein DSLPV1_132 [Dishui lake phycodnavirus 1]|uniref:hypothetical protein n=1 Tax=Dishui lake phycodnavirus 1 TaxID=2079134 RepID=UPI000CD67A7F|nr:hypothetical protein C5Y57_gp132 [Dishui lake phycodnavirus 1]AUT19103.1 hypothetical protein DSLPV1_132 [Dishui lake phycodnavirus 1]
MVMEYVNEQIEAIRAEQRRLEDEMFRIQKRYHVFEKEASALWEAGEKHRNAVLRPFAEMAGDDIWDAVLAVLDEGVNEHTYNRCKNIIGDSPKLLSAFIRACPHVMARKLQEDLCSKSHECLVVNRRLNDLYVQATRAIDSYQASTAGRTSSTQQACVQ